jgi:preprotein translocase subunit SecA
MNVLKQDTRGAAYRNEDPVQVFNKQATKLFEEMNYNIKHDVILNVLNTK